MPTSEMTHSRESLELLNKTDGIKGLRGVSDFFEVKSNSTKGLIVKILEAQNRFPPP